MPRRPGSKNKATIAAEAAFREQIIKEFQASQAADKPSEAPPTPKEVAVTIVQREDLNLGEPEPALIPSDVTPVIPEPIVPEDDPLDLEPPPPPKKRERPAFSSPEVKPKETSLDKPAAKRKTPPNSKSSDLPKPVPVISSRPLGGVFRR